VSTIVHVVRVTPDGDGGVMLGLEFDDPTAAPLDAVADFLTTRSTFPSRRVVVDRPLCDTGVIGVPGSSLGGNGPGTLDLRRRFERP
jgi:hypothetical protein